MNGPDIRIESTEVAKPVFDRKAHCQQIGMKGGMATKAKYAPNGETGYYKAIGAVGFDVYAKRHHDGNRAKAITAIKAMRNPNRNVQQPVRWAAGEVPY